MGESGMFVPLFRIALCCVVPRPGSPGRLQLCRPSSLESAFGTGGGDVEDWAPAPPLPDAPMYAHGAQQV